MNLILSNNYITGELPDHGGGVGNWLFLSATVLALAKQFNKIPVFNVNFHHLPTGKEIFRKLCFANTDNLDWKIYTEMSHGYNEISIVDNTKLIGYYQTEKYFIDYRDLILKTFAPTDYTKHYIESKFLQNINAKDCLVVHVRRGDYLSLPNVFNILNMNYYENAMKEFSDFKHMFIVSQDTDWCKEHFPQATVVNESDTIDLFLFTMIPNIIIANSTFSWWGAWLNQDPNKKIVAPRIWFNSRFEKSDLEIVPATWRTI